MFVLFCCCKIVLNMYTGCNGDDFSGQFFRIFEIIIFALLSLLVT